MRLGPHAWDLRRRIIGEDARFCGRAEIVASDHGWVYQETGSLRLRGGCLYTAGRQYRLEESPEGVRISFDDHRLFQMVRWADPRAVHICPPDRYEGVYDVTRWPSWRAQCTVTGPRKSYRIVSIYTSTAA
ncbi:MAG: DUF6314 family protein [Pseudomonadota bacterium]